MCLLRDTDRCNSMTQIISVRETNSFATFAELGRNMGVVSMIYIATTSFKETNYRILMPFFSC